MNDRLLILCEGYKDRGFWAGWLAHLGCTNLFEMARREKDALDLLLAPFGYKRSPKDFCFLNAIGDLIVVKPCGNDRAIWKEAQRELDKHEPPKRLVVNLDSDEDAFHSNPIGGRLERLQKLIQDVTQMRPSGEPPYRAGQTQVDIAVWHCPDAPGLLGVPDKQTLERLVCSAIVEASTTAEHPEGWAAAVREFLIREPRGGEGHKNYAHAYWAKFFVHEMDDLFQAVWSRDPFPQIAAQLERRLRATGAWQVAEALVNPAKDSL